MSRSLSVCLHWPSTLRSPRRHPTLSCTGGCFSWFMWDNLNLRDPSDEILQKSVGFISHVHLGESCSWKMEKGRPCQNEPRKVSVRVTYGPIRFRSVKGATSDSCHQPAAGDKLLPEPVSSLYCQSLLVFWRGNAACFWEKKTLVYNHVVAPVFVTTKPRRLLSP